MPNLKNSLLCAALFAGLSTPVFAQESTADTVVASVAGTDITLGQMIVMAGQLPQEYQSLPDDVLYQAVLDQLIRQIAIGKTIEDTLSQEAEIAMELEQIGFLAAEALNDIAENAVTDEAVQAAYDEQFAGTEPAKEYDASHILVATQEEAVAIKADLDGGADFAETAKEKSTGPSGPNGGALGWFGKGMMVKPFEDAVMTLEVGQVSDPVETQFGWHLVILNDTRDAEIPTIEQMRPEIAELLRQEAVTKALDEITASTEITRNEDGIDPAQMRNTDLIAK